MQPTAAHQLAYTNLVREYFEPLETLADLDHAGSPNRFAFIWKLFYASNAPWLEHGIDDPAKATRLLELLQGAKKTAIFTSSVDVGLWLHRFLKQELGEAAVVRLYAEDQNADPKRLSEAQRSTILDSYCYSDSVKAGIFSINLASMSIDMLTTDQVVFWDLPATGKPLPVQQAITRAVRPGNVHRAVAVKYLVHAGMLDYHAFRLLGQKLQNAKLLLDYDLESLLGVESGGTDASELAKAILGII